MTDNDEIAAFNKEVLGELEPPLVVHKKSDTPHILANSLDAQQYVIYTFQVILHSYGVFIIDCLFEAGTQRALGSNLRIDIMK